ncbi:hypothetical protein [Hyalangium gracile]|uniref:hypothetical protein n=1 Tax=Hyalangium gracile TaxID=394092 RepID=UPI001CCBFA70|nr:hypothetical protein [Hyalangium gracile]
MADSSSSKEESISPGTIVVGVLGTVLTGLAAYGVTTYVKKTQEDSARAQEQALLQAQYQQQQAMQQQRNPVTDVLTGLGGVLDLFTRR